MAGYKKDFLVVVSIFSIGGIVHLLISDFASFNEALLIFIYAGTYWATLTYSSIFNTNWLDKTIPWLQNPLKRSIYTLLVVVASTVVVVFFVDLCLDLIFLGYSFQEAINNSSVKYTHAIAITLIMNVIMHGRGFLLSWKSTATDIEKLKTEHVKTQYESLKNQVNPHFLFNSLNALSSLVHDDPDLAVKFIKKLSTVYRYVLDKKDEELVTINEEIDFVKDFVFLQKVRFGDNLDVNIDEKSIEGFVPPLAIQLLIENAIKHNVISEKHNLRVEIMIEEDFCLVSNTIKEKISKDSTGVGLNNLSMRYKYLTDKQVSVTNDGKSFKVVLPILKRKV